MGIDFRLSENQIALRDGARAFAKGVLKDVRTTIRKYAKPEDRFPFHKQGVDAGFVKGLFPKQNLVARQAQVFSIFAQSYLPLSAVHADGTICNSAITVRSNAARGVRTAGDQGM